MKIWSILLLTIILLPLIVSCGGDSNSDSEPDSGPLVNKPTLSVEKASIIFDSNNSSFDIIVTAENTSWSVDVTKGSDWLSANKNGTNVSISTKENPNTEDREGTVVVTAASDPKLSCSIIVTQKGAKAYISVNETNIAEHSFPGSFDYGKNGADYKQAFKIKSNVQWTLLGMVEWLNVSATSGNGDVELSIYPTSENPRPSPRTAELSLSSNGAESVTIYITQLGGNQNQKLIAKLIEEEGSTIYETVFSYDSQGRVVKAVKTESSATSTNSYGERTYQYGELTIISKEVVEGSYSNGQTFKRSESHSYSLENGIIVKDVEIYSWSYSYNGITGGNNSTTTSSYSYDSNGYLASVSGTKIAWTGGNLTSIGEREFTYTNIPWNKGMFFTFNGTNMDSCLWPSGYWGNTPKYMPSQDTYKKMTYNYEISNGLITKVTITNNNTGDITYISTIVWE